MHLPTRQVHLDFHTSPFINDVGVDFDAAAFAATMKAAHVNSVTVFAKCHHGQTYFPSKLGTVHPAIGDRDLLGEQITALHRAGIRAPIYTTVVWEEDVAQRFPQWRQMNRHGFFAGTGEGPDGKKGHVGMWKFNNFIHPEYQDFFEAHLREILERYGKEVDGFFIDILFFSPDAGFSDASLRFKAQHNLSGDDPATFARFQGLAQAAFAQRFTPFIQSFQPNATVFYNAQNDGNMHPQVGPRTRAAFQTHNEIESLPSGFWGYQHFPRMARAQAHWNKPWLAMTGRFQKMWGDFGGIKPQPALEFECFRSQALLGANSVGDQLPPRGTLDPAAYTLIGNVFAQIAEAEPFYQDAQLLKPAVGIFSASYAGLDGGKSEEGAVQLCEDAHYDCALIDSFDDLSPFKLLILPDSTVVDPALAQRIDAFVANGGKLLASFKGGQSPDGHYHINALPIKNHGTVAKFPTFWRARPDFFPDMSQSDRVCYDAGLNVSAPDARILVDRVLPYFQRNDLTFSSHFQTPPLPNPDAFPAVFALPNATVFADPIFREYRQTGNLAVKQVWLKVMLNLIGPPAFGHGLPSTIQVYPLRKNNDLLLTLLHYIPIRKALDIDVIEERHSFAGETLVLQSPAPSAQAFPSNSTILPNPDGSFPLPNTKGRLLLAFPNFFLQSPNP